MRNWRILAFVMIWGLFFASACSSDQQTDDQPKNPENIAISASPTPQASPVK